LIRFHRSSFFFVHPSRRLLLAAGLALLTPAAAVAFRHQWNAVLGRLGRMSEREAALRVARGREYLQHNKLKHAIHEVSDVPAGSAHEAEALTIQGLALGNLEEVGAARQALEKAWKLRPSAMAAKTLAAIYLSAYETERGRRMLQAAAELAPDDYRAWYALGEAVYLRTRKYDKAIEAFQEALKRLPDHLESRIGLIEALVKSHRPEEAEPRLRVVLRERPGDARVLLLAVGLCMELGRTAEGTRYLDQILALDPGQREALMLRARASFRAGRPQQALADVQRAGDLEPLDLAALNLLGTIQSAMGLKEEAARTLARRRDVERRLGLIEQVTHEIQQRPSDPEPRWRLGQLAAEAGMRPLAIQSFQAALALAPDCQQARQGLLDLDRHPARATPASAGALAGAAGGQKHLPLPAP
jgi:tetratricopeptide (TPR) repeat protein